MMQLASSVRVQFSGVVGVAIGEAVPTGCATGASVSGVVGSETGDFVVGSATGDSVVGSETGAFVVGSATGDSVVGSETGDLVVGSATGDSVVGSATGDSVSSGVGSATGDFVGEPVLSGTGATGAGIGVVGGTPAGGSGETMKLYSSVASHDSPSGWGSASTVTLAENSPPAQISTSRLGLRAVDSPALIGFVSNISTKLNVSLSNVNSTTVTFIGTVPTLLISNV